MTLRTQIEAAIRTSADVGQAAIAACRVLEVEIGLGRNGWVDDDDELRGLLAASPAITNPDHCSAKQEQHSQAAAVKASSSFPRSADERSAESSVQSIRDAYRSLPPAHRVRVAVFAFGLSLALTLALIRSIPEYGAGCDDTMYIAAYPQLAASSGSPAEALARRFVVLMREVSASSECNERALRDALGHASADFGRDFAEDLVQNHAHEHFMRRHKELVTIDLQSVTRTATSWDLRWAEHVRSPAGVHLRTEEYSGELCLSESNNDPDALDVAGFRAQRIAQPYGYR